MIEDEEGNESQSSAPDAAKKAQHCAGALIFAEKNQTATQPMQVGQRLGLYDPGAVITDPDIVNSVCDTIQEMLTVNGYDPTTLTTTRRRGRVPLPCRRGTSPPPPPRQPRNPDASEETA